MKISTQILIFLACLMTGSIPRPAHAQEAGLRAPVPHNQVLSANPFLLLGEWANVEFEREITPASTIGLAGSWVSFNEGDEAYKSLNGFYRYYPQGAALAGFYLGGRFGVHRVSDRYDEGHAFGLGIDVGYSWVMGAKRHFYLGLGIGATRLFGGDVEGGRVVLPSVRLLNVGVAF